MTSTCAEASSVGPEHTWRLSKLGTPTLLAHPKRSGSDAPDVVHMDMVASQDGLSGHADDFAVFPDPDARCDTPAGDLAGGLNALSDQQFGLCRVGAVWLRKPRCWQGSVAGSNHNVVSLKAA